MVALAPQRTDDEISIRVAKMVNAGEIKPELAQMFERALRTKLRGKTIVMRDPGVRSSSAEESRAGRCGEAGEQQLNELF